jgi:hypothetical protein
MDIESFVSQALEQLGAGVDKARGKPGITFRRFPIRTNARTLPAIT